MYKILIAFNFYSIYFPPWCCEREEKNFAIQKKSIDEKERDREIEKRGIKIEETIVYGRWILWRQIPLFNLINFLLYKTNPMKIFLSSPRILNETDNKKL